VGGLLSSCHFVCEAAPQSGVDTGLWRSPTSNTSTRLLTSMSRSPTGGSLSALGAPAAAVCFLMGWPGLAWGRGGAVIDKKRGATQTYSRCGVCSAAAPPLHARCHSSCSAGCIGTKLKERADRCSSDVSCAPKRTILSPARRARCMHDSVGSADAAQSLASLCMQKAIAEREEQLRHRCPVREFDEPFEEWSNGENSGFIGLTLHSPITIE